MDVKFGWCFYFSPERGGGLGVFVWCQIARCRVAPLPDVCSLSISLFPEIEYRVDDDCVCVSFWFSCYRLRESGCVVGISGTGWQVHIALLWHWNPPASHPHPWFSPGTAVTVVGAFFLPFFRNKQTPGGGAWYARVRCTGPKCI